MSHALLIHMTDTDRVSIADPVSQRADPIDDTEQGIDQGDRPAEPVIEPEPPEDAE